MRTSGAPREPAAVLLGGELGTLSIARSLARAGIEVAVLLGAGRASPLTLSRACRTVAFRGTGDVRDGWLEWLRGRPLPGAVVLPCADEAVEFLAGHRRELVELGYRPSEGDDSVALAMLDKEETYARARRLGVACPATVALHEDGDLEQAAARLGFPLALKPLASHRFGPTYGVRKAFVVEDRVTLERVHAETRGRGIEMLATEIVPERTSPCDSYFTYLDEVGEPLFDFTKRKLRQWPLGFGYGSYHVSRWDPEVAAEGRRFLQGVGLRGLGVVEFKRDPRDGQLKLIECNHRVSDANELVRRAGLDCGLLSYARALGRRPRPRAAFREGIALWFVAEDTRAFLEHRRSGELTAPEWLRTLSHPPCFPVLALDDPAPSVAHATRLAGRALRKAARTLVGRNAPPRDGLASAESARPT